MKNNHKILSNIGLAMRARKIVLGQDMILQAMAKEPHALVFLASDAGDNIKKKILDKAKTYTITIISDFTSDQLSQAIGKSNRKVVLMKDKGFIELILKQVNS